MKSIDGLGNADGLAAGSGLTAGVTLFGIAAFAHQDGLACVLVGFAAACFAFLAFNVRPASLFVGRGGRLGIGFTLAVGALAVDPVPVSWRELTTPLILLGIFVLDGLMVAVYRLRRRRSLLQHRNDHVLHRFVALGWTTGEAVIFLVAAEVILSVIALFTARGVFPFWLTAGSTVLVLLVVGIEAGRSRLEREQPRGLPGWAWIVVLLLVVWLVAATAPLVLAGNDAVDRMQSGREAATRALNAAREATRSPRRARSTRLPRRSRTHATSSRSPLTSTGLALPFLASNVSAARTLADIGTDLANAGESLTAAVRSRRAPGRRRSPPDRRGDQDHAAARARGGGRSPTRAARLDDLRDDPYLVAQVRDAVDKVYEQLAQADREARHAAAAAAELAPAIFGADGDRDATSSWSRTTPSHAPPAGSSAATRVITAQTASSTSAT